MRNAYLSVAASGALAAGMCLAMAPVESASAGIDLDTPEGAVAAMRRIMCSENDNEPTTYWWNGHMFSRVPGEPDRRLFRVEGMNVRQCVTVEDPDRGTGYRLVTREILLYKDPDTHEVLWEWDNPWTGETVEVMHIANDPVNGRPTFPYDADGNPSARFNAEVQGDKWWMTVTVPLFYENPLGGDYQEWVGNKYQATEMFNFMGRVSELTAADRPIYHPHVGWVRQSDWLPWMKMRGRAGLVYFHTAGRKLESFEDLSDTMREAIDEHWPEYTEPPPGDDDRPNETSWTYFKKMVDARDE